MSVVSYALKRPYTIVSVVILVLLLGVLAASQMATDIFPSINIPVVSVVWTYNGMSADDIQNRILIQHERQMPSIVDDIQRIEANSYTGVGVIKVYLQEGADVSRAVSQLTSSAQVVLKTMPPNITPPLILRYGATDVPIIQLSLSSDSLPDQKMTDFGQNVIRPALAVVQGASVPYPYGGKPRLIMVDLDQRALSARGMSPNDVSNALAQENVIAPSGDVKMGSKDYQVLLNNSPATLEAINQFPVKKSADGVVLLRDVAHVHDGFQVQTNSVSSNGKPATLITVRKTGKSSTLNVIDGIKSQIPYITNLLPKGMRIKALFDQSVFVKASLNSVLLGGAMAAGLTALMILLFLGNWRLTLIILASIPLSIIVAVLVMYLTGETLNTMTLGGFALAVGILVDNATVVIENIERNHGMGKGLIQGIEEGAAEIGVPTLVSTVAICIVFVPVFLLQGVAKYLFAPLSLSVILSLLASLVISFTLVPILFKLLMRSTFESHQLHPEPVADDPDFWGATHKPSETPVKRKPRNLFSLIHHGFEVGFEYFRKTYQTYLSWAVSKPIPVSIFFLILFLCSIGIFPLLGRDFFPQVDAGQMRLHVRTPPGTKIEDAQQSFAQVETEIRRVVGNDQIDVVLDNIGLPYSGINIALSDTATVGPMDGEILVSLKENHTPTADHVARLRNELPKKFASMRFFFQPADIVNQVLNFGQPAPVDIRVIGPHNDLDFATATKLVADLRQVPGLADVHIFQVPNAPAIKVTNDRVLAREMNMSQRDVGSSVLVALNSSAMVSPNFWLDPKNNVSYPLVVQTPQYQVDTMSEFNTIPVNDSSGMTSGAPTAGGTAKPKQLLMNVAQVSRGTVPMVSSQVNIRPVFDVQADVQGTDLATAARAIDKVIANNTPDAKTGIKIELAGQVQTMRQSFNGLAGGIGLAVILIFLLMMVYFQSWVDPLIVLGAVPFALCGVIWMLYATETHISVPALMGTLMCIGLTTANSLLVVSFANQRLAAGVSPSIAAVEAGVTRLRPVLMTAGAMILGMIPMALGIGEGGEQNAPLGRAVIGGLLFATFATLIFVPAVYRLVRKSDEDTQLLSNA